MGRRVGYNTEVTVHSTYNERPPVPGNPYARSKTEGTEIRIPRSNIFRAIYLAGRRGNDGGITILSYHSIDEHDTGISVRPGLFAEQMAALAAEGCVSFTMSEVAQRMHVGTPFPRRAVAITFDDGFANVAEVAAPIMSRYGFNATVYVITGMVGRITGWTAHGAALPPQAIADWGQIERLQRCGVEIGAHTASHGFLTACTDEELPRELAEPKALLEARLGVPVNSFAYPQGDYDARVVAAVRRAGYSSAVTIDQGRVVRGSDLFMLPRLHVGNNATPDVIRAFVVPTIGPAYRLVNLLMHRVLRKSTWPRPSAQHIQSTRSVPRGALS